MPFTIKNQEEFFKFVEKAKSNELKLENMHKVNKALSLKIKQLRTKSTWETYFIQQIKDSLDNSSEINEDWFSIVEKNIIQHLNELEEKNTIIHPKYFLLHVLYPLLSKEGYNGLIVYQNLVKDIQNFLLQPYKQSVKQCNIEIPDGDYFNPVQFIKDNQEVFFSTNYKQDSIEEIVKAVA
jgi:hypothetical protein